MSKTTKPKMIVAVFRDPDDAEAAYDWLVRRGFDEINVLMTEETRAVRFAGEPMGKTGSLAVEGMAVGGAVGTAVGATLAAVVAIGTSVAIPGVGVVAGPLAAALVGAGAGAVTGGLLGALVGWGIPEADAKAYEKVVKEGGVVLGVVPRSDDDARAIEEKFRELHGENISRC
jgi:hypothetical protein